MRRVLVGVAFVLVLSAGSLLGDEAWSLSDPRRREFPFRVKVPD